MQTIQKYIVESKKVLFEGDGYSEAWHHEAERRGLPNIPTAPLALDAMVDEKKTLHLFKKNNVFTHSELEARHEIELEKYIKKIQIEARVMGDLALNHIIPAAINYQNKLLTNINGLKTLGFKEADYAGQLAILKDVSKHLQFIYEQTNALVEARKIVNKIEDTRTKAIAYCSQVKETYFNKLRYHVDKLERLVNDDDWTLPKYRELLFLK
jgi:glutamine synthetase